MILEMFERSEICLLESRLKVLFVTLWIFLCSGYAQKNKKSGSYGRGITGQFK